MCGYHKLYHSFVWQPSSASSCPVVVARVSSGDGLVARRPRETVALVECGQAQAAAGAKHGHMIHLDAVPGSSSPSR